MERLTRHYVTLIFLAVIWGSSFILMKKGLEVFDFVQVAILRIIIAFLSLLPFLFRSIKKVKSEHFLPLLATAFVGNGIPAFLFAKAQENLDSAFVGTLNATVPLFTFIFGFYFFGYKFTKKNIFGVVLGLIGVIFLSYINTINYFKLNYFVLVVILATMCYAISINVIKKYLSDLDAITISTMVFLIIGPLSIFYIFTTSFFSSLEFSYSFYKAIFYISLLAILGTSGASIIFNKLVNETSPIFVSTITYLIPVVAIFWGMVDGEIITSNHLLGFAIILSSIYLINKKT